MGKKIPPVGEGGVAPPRLLPFTVRVTPLAGARPPSAPHANLFMFCSIFSLKQIKCDLASSPRTPRARAAPAQVQRTDPTNGPIAAAGPPEFARSLAPA